MAEQENKKKKLEEIQARLAEIQNKPAASKPTSENKSSSESKKKSTSNEADSESRLKNKTKPTESKKPEATMKSQEKPSPKKEVSTEAKPKTVEKTKPNIEQKAITQEEKNWKANRSRNRGKDADKPKAKVQKEGPKQKKKSNALSKVFTIISLVITLGIASYFIYTFFISPDSGELVTEIPVPENEADEETASEGEDRSETTDEISEDSEATNDELLEDDGTDEVSEVALEESTPKQEPPVKKRSLSTSPAKNSPSIEAAVPKGVIISYSINSTVDLAEANVRKLRNKGYDAGYYYMPDKEEGSKAFYRVYVGPFDNEAEAWEKLSSVSKMEMKAFIMK